MAEKESLEQQIQELQTELEKQKQTNRLLKKRTLQAIIGNRGVEQCEADRKECEIGRAQAELASRVKSVFLENVSHEIRSAMNGILGMTELVLETELSSEQRVYLEMVDTSVERLMVVVNQILDFSSIETGELEVIAEDFSLKETLDHDLFVLNLSAQRKGIELSCKIEPNVPTHIHGDGARLVQVVSNLVSNGIKFTGKGKVEVTISNEGYDEENNLLLRFDVRDSGCGIERDKLDIIQHYFSQEQLPKVVLPLSVGAGGLGLTVTSQLVKLMGGQIGVESDEKGSDFWFVLPFKEVADVTTVEQKANETLQNIQEEAVYALRGAKVLLAEDEYINRVLIETVLKQLGVDVTSVDDGEEAVERVCEGDFELVLMDIQMDRMDGFEATRRIRKYEKKHGGHIPIVALTALAMGGDREKCFQAGMDDYLAKPVERKDMVKILTQFLTSRALVVDGDPESQNVLVRSLIESGWQVTIAETKRSAMYEASLSHFDLIIFDLSTPHLDGMECVKIIRKLEEYSGQKARVIGLSEDSMEEELRAKGVDCSLQRPVTFEKVDQKLYEMEVSG